MRKLFRKIDQARETNEAVRFVIDSPRRAWIPIAAVIEQEGFNVYRPTTSLMKSMRQGASRKNKTNRIDAKALARCLMSHPDEVNLVFLPHGTSAQLDQTVRRRDRLVDGARRRKQRIQDLCEAINPTLMLTAQSSRKEGSK